MISIICGTMCGNLHMYNYYCDAQCSALVLWLWNPLIIFKALSLCRFITIFQLVSTAWSVSSLAVFIYQTSDCQNFPAVSKFTSTVVALFHPVAIGKLCHPKHHVAVSAKNGLVLYKGNVPGSCCDIHSKGR